MQEMEGVEDEDMDRVVCLACSDEEPSDAGRDVLEGFVCMAITHDAVAVSSATGVRCFSIGWAV